MTDSDQKKLAKALFRKIKGQWCSDKLKDLYTPGRYKIYYGGRGSGKSEGICESIIYRMMIYPDCKVLCCREFQSKISESSKATIERIIRRLGLKKFFNFTNTEIKCVSGAKCIFEGVHNNEDGIKSIDGITLAFFEEAHKMTEKSWDLLTPSIRGTNAQIILAFNPQSELDFVSKKFILERNSLPKDEYTIIKMNYMDNKYFDETANYNDMIYCKEIDYKKYLHIWEGEFEQQSANMLFNVNDLRLATKRPIPVESSIKIAAWDVAYAANGDRSCIMIREGLKIDDDAIWVWQGVSLTEQVRRVQTICIENDVDILIIDYVGCGAHSLQELEEKIGNMVSIVPFNAGAKSTDGRYYKIKTECYFLAAEWCKKARLPDNEELLKDLACISYSIDKNDSKIKLATKDEIRAKYNLSPDLGDAFSMTFYPAINLQLKKPAPIDVSKFTRGINGWI